MVEPYRAFGIEIAIARPQGEGRSRSGAATRRSSTASPISSRTPSTSPRAASRSRREWDDREVAVTVSDDGRGFTPAIIDRIGEPYVTTRGPAGDDRAHHEAGGLGLGLFIAKTLLERTGARLTFGTAIRRDAARWSGWLAAGR